MAGTRCRDVNWRRKKLQSCRVEEAMFSEKGEKESERARERVREREQCIGFMQEKYFPKTDWGVERN